MPLREAVARYLATSRGTNHWPLPRSRSIEWR
jgi:hypothetical protein